MSIEGIMNAGARNKEAEAKLLEAAGWKERAEKAEALVADLENQIAELMAGMDQAQADAAAKDAALRSCIDWLDIECSDGMAAYKQARQALSYHPGDKLLAVIETARGYVDIKRRVIASAEVNTAFFNFAQALDALDGRTG